MNSCDAYFVWSKNYQITVSLWNICHAQSPYKLLGWWQKTNWSSLTIFRWWFQIILRFHFFFHFMISLEHKRSYDIDICKFYPLNSVYVHVSFPWSYSSCCVLGINLQDILIHMNVDSKFLWYWITKLSSPQYRQMLFQKHLKMLWFIRIW